MDSLNVEQLAKAFCACTLPKSAWTHEAHLRVGLWHVIQFGADESLDLLRLRIKGFNESVGGENTDSAGYHETITRFYVAVIARFLEGADRNRPLDELADELIARCGAKDLPLRFWSKEQLGSVVARRGWVEPDLQGLDGIGEASPFA